MKAKLTRRSQIGWGYNTTPTGVGTEIEATTRPKFTGTVRTVISQILADRDYQSMKNSTYHSRGWFVRLDGNWKKIHPEVDMFRVAENLTVKSDWGNTGEKLTYFSNEEIVDII